MNTTPDKEKHWIHKANIENANFIIEKDNTILWHYGLWIDGTWYSGIWKNGIWHDGYWENGIWKSGTWKKGIWESGLWENGIWLDGCWMSGIWKDGTWKKGWIYDPEKVGNYDPNWRWDEDCVYSTISPKEYFK